MTDRLHSLDFLRAFALLMGVLLHVLMLFLEPFDGSEARLGASIIFIWIHTWRMPLFMLLAGFFTALYYGLVEFTLPRPLMLEPIRLTAPRKRDDASPRSASTFGVTDSILRL